jgi:hypothetical protein
MTDILDPRGLDAAYVAAMRADCGRERLPGDIQGHWKFVIDQAISAYLNSVSKAEHAPTPEGGLSP